MHKKEIIILALSFVALGGAIACSVEASKHRVAKGNINGYGWGIILLYPTWAISLIYVILQMQHANDMKVLLARH